MHLHAIACHATESPARSGEDQEDKSTAMAWHAVSASRPQSGEQHAAMSGSDLPAGLCCEVNPSTIVAAKGKLNATAPAQYANLVLELHKATLTSNAHKERFCFPIE